MDEKNKKLWRFRHEKKCGGTFLTSFCWIEVLKLSRLAFLSSQAKRQQRKLNFLITQTELYAHFMSGKASMAAVGGDATQEDILRKLEDNSAQRQIDVGGGVMVNVGQEDYGIISNLSNLFDSLQKQSKAFVNKHTKFPALYFFVWLQQCFMLSQKSHDEFDSVRTNQMISSAYRQWILQIPSLEECQRSLSDSSRKSKLIFLLLEKFGHSQKKKKKRQKNVNVSLSSLHVDKDVWWRGQRQPQCISACCG